MLLFSSRSAARTAAFATAALLSVTPRTALSAAKPQKTPARKISIESVPGEYVVELKPTDAPGFGAMDVRSLSAQLGAEVVDRVRPEVVLVRASVQSRSSTRSVESTRSFEMRLRESPLVASVEPNYIYRSSRRPNDPGLSRTWGLKNTGVADTSKKIGIAGVDISALSAWNITTGSKSIIVAVIDTGIDFKHPDLKSQAWVNLKEFNGTPGVDDDRNGFVDDINGYNFVDDKGDATDDGGHGSHCAGTIGAKGNDGKGLVGVNWDVSLMALKFLDKEGSGTLANAVKSIDYARKMGAKIMSNSWGGGARSNLLEKTIEDAARAGVLFVVAAGNEANDNDANPSFPSSYEIDNVLSVAAIDNRGSLATFSNYGATSVDVAAPGVNIVSTVPGGGYDSYSGTSMAAPHVSGIAALLLANNSNLSYRDLKKTIINSARPLYTLRKRVVSGAADAYYALSGQTPPPDPNDPARLKNVKRYAFSTEHPYKDDTKLVRKISALGAKRMAIRFSSFDTEASYDAVSFYDSKGKFVSAMSGWQEAGVTSPLIDGDSITIKFESDEGVTGYGFDVEAVLFD